MTPEQQQFCELVAQRITVDPEIAGYLPQYISSGIRNALRQANERAADMEIALVAMSNARLKNGRDLMREKLTKWEGKTAINWREILKEKP